MHAYFRHVQINLMHNVGYIPEKVDKITGKIHPSRPLRCTSIIKGDKITRETLQLKILEIRLFSNRFHIRKISLVLITENSEVNFVRKLSH